MNNYKLLGLFIGLILLVSVVSATTYLNFTYAPVNSGNVSNITTTNNQSWAVKTTGIGNAVYTTPLTSATTYNKISVNSSRTVANNYTEYDRAILTFNVSNLNTWYSVNSADLYIQGYSTVNNTVASSFPNAYTVFWMSGTPANPLSYVAADYAKNGTTFMTVGIPNSSFIKSNRMVFNLTSAGISALSMTGTTSFYGEFNFSTNNTAPTATANKWDYFQFYTNASSTANRPLLVVNASPITAFPNSSFTVNTTSGYYPIGIMLNDTTLGLPTTFNISWGDGTWSNSTTANGTHTYSSGGAFNLYEITNNTIGTNTSATTIINVYNTLLLNSTAGTYNWTIPTGVTQIQYLIIGGGGAGGGGPSTSGGLGGGGGAGGVLTGSLIVYPGEILNITVGNGGTQNLSSPYNPAHGNNGTNSYFGNLTTNFTAIGGGGGGAGNTSADNKGWNGGSGGGAAWDGTDYTPAGGTGVAGQGKNGGAMSQYTFSYGGGGGGNQSVGGQDAQGFGGTGYTSTIYGTPLTVAGGGNGANNLTTQNSGGGLGSSTSAAGGNGTTYGSGGGGGAGYIGGAGANGVIIVTYVSSGVVPTTIFNLNTTSGYVQQGINLTDTSINSPQVFNVSWGDNTWTNSTTPNATHTYTSNGTYSVFEITNNTIGSNQAATQTVTIQSPIAQFTTNNTIIQPGASILFTSTSSGTVLNYNWTFGDGTFSNGSSSSVSHTYSNCGNYITNLTIIGVDGVYNLSTSITITSEASTISLNHFDDGINGLQPNNDSVLGNNWNYTGTSINSNISINTTLSKFGTSSMWFNTNPGFTPTASFTNNGLFTQLANTWNTGSTIDFWIYYPKPILTVGFLTVNNNNFLTLGSNSYYNSIGLENVSGSVFLNLQSYDGNTGLYSFANDYITPASWHYVILEIQKPKIYASTDGGPFSSITPYPDSFANPGVGSNVSFIPQGDGLNGTAYYLDEARFTNILLYPTNSASIPIPTSPGTAGTCPSGSAVPVVSFTTNTSVGVVPQTIWFNDTSTDPTITNWNWSIDSLQNNNYTSTTNFTYTFQSGGNYTVTETVANASGGNSTSQIVTIYNQTKSIFTSNVTSGVFPQVIQFNDSSLNATFWNWSFGDGQWSNQTSSALKNVTHLYATGGNYTITENTSEYNYGYSNSSEYIQINNKTISGFTANTTSGNAPLSILFSVTTPNDNATFWNWSPDGITWTNGTTQNFTYTYTTYGTYSVTEKSNNSFTGNSTTLTNYIVVHNATPTASFSGSPLSGAIPLSVTFTDASTGSGILWWNFSYGDGTFGNFTTTTNPTHSYSSVGTFTVSETVTNDGGTNTQTQTNYITTSPASPTVNFISNTTTGFVYPYAVQFTDTSTGSPNMWNWSFGDNYWYNGTNASAQNPIHIYDVAGSYTVTLIATNTGGTSSTTKINYLTLQSDIDAYVFSWMHMSSTDAYPFQDLAGLTWVVSNATNFATPSYFGNGSGDFQGVNAYLGETLPSSLLGTNDFTLEGWIYPSTATMGSQIVSNAPNASYLSGWGLINPTGTQNGYVFYMGNSVTNSTPTFMLSNGQWSNIVVERVGGSTIEVYVNGQLVATKTGLVGTYDLNSTVSLGYMPYGLATSQFNGFLEETRFSIGIARWLTNFTTPYAAYRGNLYQTYPDINPNSTLKFDLPLITIGNGTQYNGGITDRTINIKNITNATYIVGSTSYNPLISYASTVIPNASTYNNVQIVSYSVDPIGGVILFNITRPGGFSPGTSDVSIADIPVLYWNYSSQQNYTSIYDYGYLINGSTSVTYPFTFFQSRVTQLQPWTIVANYTANRTNITVNDYINATDNSYLHGAYPNRWNWSFGDGQVDNGSNQTVNHQYTSTGTFNLSVIEYLYQNGSVYNTTQKNITVVDKVPIVSFISNVTNGLFSLPVQFTDTSSGATLLTWNWSFGDGSLSTLQNPVHTYTRGGNFTVSLNVSSSGGYNLTTVTNYIQVYNTTVSGFSADITNSELPRLITFTVTTPSDNATQWNWSWGDNTWTNGSTQNQTHTYTTQGIYTVSETTSNLYATNTTTRSNYITVYNHVSTGFIANVTSGVRSLPVLFTVNNVSDNASQWNWSFGDGSWTNGSTQNPTHTYTTQGIYTVSETANSTFTSSTSTQTNYIHVYDPIFADFTSNTQYGFYDITNPYPVTFTDASTGITINGWSWDFGNGDQYTGTPTPPSEDYVNPGTYTVSLTITNATGITNTTSKLNYITFYPTVIPTANVTSGTAPTTIQFNDSTNWSDKTSWNWSFGDGSYSSSQNTTHTYSTGGTYQAFLNVYNTHGNATNFTTITISTPLIVNFTANITSGYVPLAVNFTDASTGNNILYWNWSFGDGTWFNTTSSITNSPIHTYTTNGTYTVIESITNNMGTNSSTRTNYITTTGLISSFTLYPQTNAYFPDYINFTDTSLGGPTNWNWSFGDTYYNNSQNPSHVYLVSGNYTVIENVSNAYGYNRTSSYVKLTSDTDPNLTSWMQFNNATITDLRGNAWSVAGGAAIETTTVKSGWGSGALSIPSVGAHAISVSAPQWNIGNGPFAMQFQLYPISTVGTNNVISRTNLAGAGTTSGWAFTDTLTGYEFWMGNIANASTPFSLPLNTWSWVWIDRNTTGYINIYVNGNLTTTSYQPGSFDIVDSVRIGSGSGIADTYYLDEFRMSSNASRISPPLYENNPPFAPPVTQYNGMLYPNNINPNATLLTKAYPNTPDAVYNQTFTANPYHYRTVQIQNITNASYINVSEVYEPLFEYAETPVANTTNYPNIIISNLTQDSIDGLVTFTVSLSNNSGIQSLFDNRTNLVDVPYLYYNYSTEQNVTTYFSDGSIYDDANNAFDPVVYFYSNPIPLGTWIIYNNWTSNVTQTNINKAIQFTDNSLGEPNGWTNWSWAFGNGDTSTSQNPIYTYSVAGNYTVNLTVSLFANSSVTNTTTHYINIYALPISSFTENVTNGLFPLAVMFNDTSTNYPTIWNWSFGDGQYSATQNTTHIYYSGGNYTITLTASNIVGNSTSTKYIDVWNKTTSSFTSNVTSGYIPLSVQFTGTATNTSPTPSYYWLLGDGGTSTLLSPVYTYNSVGTYNVNFSVSNGHWTNWTNQTNYITASQIPAPVSSFTENTTNGLFPLPIAFTDTSSGLNINYYNWSFGDGTYASTQNAIHTYNTGGNYTITHSVGNAGGNSSSVNYVDIWNTTTSGFTANTTSGYVPLAIQFTDTSSNATSWLTLFGDGNTSTTKSPLFVYNVPGIYNINHSASNTHYTNWTNLTAYITATQIPAPTASFAANQTSGLAAMAVQFTDTSIGSPTSWNWSFGDGQYSTAQSPVHTFGSGGLYTIILNASNAGGSNTSTKSNYITVNNRTVSGFTYNVSSGLYPLDVGFNVTTVNDNATQWNWSFGDGNWQNGTQQNSSHEYNTGGTYTVSETASNLYASNTTTLTNIITVFNHTTSSFTSNVTSGYKPFDVQFIGTATNTTPTPSYYWLFGDGGTSTLLSPDHTYTTQGLFNVNFSVSNGYWTNWTNQTNYINSSNHPAPIASFTQNQTSGYEPLAVLFNDTSSGYVIYYWNWSFGDGTYASTRNATHVYVSGGTFIVNLTVTNEGGTSYAQNSVVVNVPTPTASFTDNNTATAYPQTIQFIDTSSGPGIYSWSWNFGTGATSSAQNPIYIYNTGGTFTVGLTVISTYGTSSTSQTITVYNQSTSAFVSNITNGYVPAAILFTGTSTNATSYLWLFGDGGNSTQLSPTYTYNTPGVYSVDFAAINPYWTNWTNQSNYVTIATHNATPTVYFTGTPTSGYIPLVVQFTDATTGSDLQSWNWSFGDGFWSNQTNILFKNVTHTYSTPGIFTVSEYVTNDGGTGFSTQTNYITAIQTAPPNASFYYDQHVGYSPLGVHFTDTSSNAPTSWNWSFRNLTPGNNTYIWFSTAQNPSYVFGVGNWSIQLNATNVFGTNTTLDNTAFILVNQSTSAYGGVSQMYNFTVGKDKLILLVNVPLSIEDVAYPVSLFYWFITLGFISILLGVIFTIKRGSVPSIAILACGIIAFGVFLIAAYMAPLVANYNIDYQIIPTLGNGGATLLNATNTIYITGVTTYIYSAWVSYLMYGGAITGFIIMLLGTLSWLGWFETRGQTSAFNGEYLETDEENNQRRNRR